MTETGAVTEAEIETRAAHRTGHSLEIDLRSVITVTKKPETNPKNAHKTHLRRDTKTTAGALNLIYQETLIKPAQEKETLNVGIAEDRITQNFVTIPAQEI